MVECIECGTDADDIIYCDMCGEPMCIECGVLGLCSECSQAWESEIDLEDIDEELEW